MNRYIVTDPCYVLSQESYDLLLNRSDKKRDKFMSNPIAAREPPLYCHTQKETRFHSGYPYHLDGGKDNDICKVIRCRGTRNGDGGVDGKSFKIGVDSGLLCAAYCKNGFGKRYWGATFATENAALNALERFANRI